MCLYKDDRATMERDGYGKVRCEYYDGKVLSGKFGEIGSTSYITVP